MGSHSMDGRVYVISCHACATRWQAHHQLCSENGISSVPEPGTGLSRKWDRFCSGIRSRPAPEKGRGLSREWDQPCSRKWNSSDTGTETCTWNRADPRLRMRTRIRPDSDRGVPRNLSGKQVPGGSPFGVPKVVLFGPQKEHIWRPPMAPGSGLIHVLDQA